MARGLGDPSPWVQRAAVTALCAREDFAALRPFAEGTWGDPYARGAAADCVPAPVATLWASAEPWGVAPLALAPARAGDATALAALTERLAAGDISFDPGFSLALARSGLTALRPALVAGQERIEEELALDWYAIRAALGDETALPPLRAALCSDNLDDAHQIVDFLAAVASPQGEALLRCAAKRAQPEVATRARLITANPSRARLMAALEEDAVEVRLQAVRAADALPPRQRREVIRFALGDFSVEVRLEALDALARLGVEGEEAGLTQMTAEDLLEVQVAAAILLATGPQ